MSFITIDNTTIPTDLDAISSLPIQELIYNGRILDTEIYITDEKNKYNKIYKNYISELTSIQSIYYNTLTLKTNTLPYRSSIASNIIYYEKEDAQRRYHHQMTEFYKIKNKIMKKCDKKTKTKKQKKSDWVDSKYKPVCRCPYKFRIITWRNGGYGDMRYYMRCPICDKSDFNNDIKIQEQIRQQNINIGLYLRHETTDINIINSLPIDLSKHVIQYI